MNSSAERRDFWRVPFQSLARLTNKEGVARECRLGDISLKGALLEMDDHGPLHPGDTCRLQIDLSPEISIRMQMTVMHIAGQRIGLRCNEIDLDSITALRRLVELNSGDPILLERELGALVHGALTGRG